MRLPALLIILAALAGCGSGSTHSSVTVENAIVRLPAVPGRPAAGYATVTAKNRGGLTGVSSSKAQQVEMHATRMTGSRVEMEAILEIDSMDGVIAFEPGGRHLMLFGLDPAVKAGGRIDLTFRFGRGEPVTASARVIGAGDDVPQ